MKNISIYCIILFLLLSCKQQQTRSSEFLTIDVQTHYPILNLELTDIADIEYIKLETDEDYLFRNPPYIISENYIIMYNYDIGDIIFYDKKGKPAKKINRFGNGPGEYNTISTILYDEKNDELFVLSYTNKGYIYTGSGEFKREFPVREKSFYAKIYDFDKDHIIAYDNRGNHSTSFLLIEKSTGDIIEEIPLFYDQKLDIFITKQVDNGIVGIRGDAFFAVKHKNGYLLNEHSLDTLYLYTQERELIPQLVRTPASQSMDPLIYMNSYLETKDYYFMSHIKKEYDWDTRQGLATTLLVVKKNSGEIHKQNITFKDFKNRTFHLSPETIEKTNNPEIGCIIFNADELLDAYEDNRLSGELKKIAKTLEPDDNPLVMLLKFK